MEKYQPRNKNKGNKGGNYNNNQHYEQKYVKKQSQITASREEGFTGTTEDWFNGMNINEINVMCIIDEEFRK